MFFADIDTLKFSDPTVQIAAFCLAGALVLFILKKLLFGGGKKAKGKLKQPNLREILDEYPDAPPAPTGRRLLLDGMEVRLRLVVLAPAGTRRAALQADDATELLDDLLRGLGAFINADRPRVRIWPAQLSAAGFAPTFFRLVESPDPAGTKSRWLRLAGAIRIAGEPYLLGLAFWSEEASKLGAIDVAPNKWSDLLKVER